MKPVRLESVTVLHPELAELYGLPEVREGDRTWATLEEYEAERGPLFGPADPDPQTDRFAEAMKRILSDAQASLARWARRMRS